MTSCDGCQGCPSVYHTLDVQPLQSDALIANGVHVKAFTVQAADTYLPQHSHVYDHISYVASGAVMVWADGDLMGVFTAPSGIVIKAGVKHMFRTLVDNTTVLCIHGGDPLVADEHVVERV